MKFKCITHLKCRTVSFLPHPHHESPFSLTHPHFSFLLSGLFCPYTSLSLSLVFPGLFLLVHFLPPSLWSARTKEREKRRRRRRGRGGGWRMEDGEEEERGESDWERGKKKLLSFSVHRDMPHRTVFLLTLSHSGQVESDDPCVFSLCSIFGHMVLFFVCILCLLPSQLKSLGADQISDFQETQLATCTRWTVLGERERERVKRCTRHRGKSLHRGYVISEKNCPPQNIIDSLSHSAFFTLTVASDMQGHT